LKYKIVVGVNQSYQFNQIQITMDNAFDTHRTLDGNTILHQAVITGSNIHFIEYLLIEGVGKDHLNNQNKTAAEIADAKGNHVIAEFIRSYDSMPVKGVNT